LSNGIILIETDMILFGPVPEYFTLISV